eukprot:TRINITY_DN9505_c0_g1_i1.p1 TRINITY_DN9505_c0_g1~~TRINITY_DN9505_c0_g1_i1.p1  ORF type:complete len:593 (-),score=76.11 TRINITY_DN9505_c0_g1_i1:192-1970(-)
MLRSLVGSEMCIRDRSPTDYEACRSWRFSRTLGASQVEAAARPRQMIPTQRRARRRLPRDGPAWYGNQILGRRSTPNMQLRLDVPAVPCQNRDLPIVNAEYERELEAERARHAHVMESKQNELGEQIHGFHRQNQHLLTRTPLPQFPNEAPVAVFTPASGRWAARGTSLASAISLNHPFSAHTPLSPVRSRRQQPSPEVLKQRKEEHVKRSQEYLRHTAVLNRQVGIRKYESWVQVSIETSNDPQTITLTNHTKDKVRLANWRLESAGVECFKFPWSSVVSAGECLVVWCTAERPPLSDVSTLWWKQADQLFVEDSVRHLVLLSEQGTKKGECELVGIPAPPPQPTGPSLLLGPLSHEQEKEVNAALKSDPDQELVHFKKGRTDVSMNRTELECMRPTEWLNDKAIEIYMNLVMMMRDSNPELPNVAQIKNSFFFTRLTDNGYDYSAVKSWTKKMKDLLSKDKIMVPINKGCTHWVLAVINIRDKRFEFYDALPTPGEQRYERDCLEHLRRWICDESQDKLKREMDLSQWTNYIPTDIPHQQNGYDCGMFALKYAQCVALDLELETMPFSQRDIQDFRRRAILEMMNTKIEL